MNDEYWMSQALELAQKAREIGEVPVGALVVRDQQIIASAWNAPISLCDPTAHCEILALRQAAQKIGNYRLVDCDLYVTLEPCAMCTGAIIHSRVKRLVYAATEPKAGAIESRLRLINEGYGNHYLEVVGGVLAEQSSNLISSFFSERRKQIKQQKQSSQQ
ncbi:tRNA adenosine(34) deaminase TadA [Sessilibacter sp. MAH1]